MAALANSYKALGRYLPEGSMDLLIPLLGKYPLQLTISKPRKTKFGDYRFPQGNQPHRISINGNLNPYSFLITLLHEYAHLVAFDKFGRKIKPHGEEWQYCFKHISLPFLEANIFPQKLKLAFRQSLACGHASSATDLQLLRVLKDYDKEVPNDELTFVENLQIGELFLLNGRVFKRGPKSRKRYRCKEIESTREYMVHPLAEVNRLETKDEHS